MVNCCVTETKVTSCWSNSLDQLGEVHEDAAEAVDLVDDDDVDHAGLDIAQQALQGGPLQRAARDAAVVVAVGQRHPALGRWLAMKASPGLALGVEAVELLLQALLAGLAGVDRAAELRRIGAAFSLPLRRPKNRGPFHRVPVMVRATADRLW